MVERASVRIHPTAEVSSEAVIGDGSSVWNQAQVRERARIGRRCIIGKNAYIDFDVVLGDDVKVQNNVSVFHGVTVESGVFIGPHVCFTNDRIPRAVTPDGSLKRDDDWDVVVDVNLKGPFLGMRHAVPRMVEAGGGSIVALGSTLGQITQPQYAAYCASKFGLTNLCKQVAIEHAKDGVRVNVVAPSATDTGLFMKLTAMAPDPDGLRRQVAANMPMQRLARAEEVCEAVLFLLSDASSYTSGAVLPVDGGLAARRS